MTNQATSRPFQVSGATDLDTRVFQVGQHLTLRVSQLPRLSQSLRPLLAGSADDAVGSAAADALVEWPGGEDGQEGSQTASSREQLANVGLCVWQSGFVLAELLLRLPPYGQFADVTVVELGCGTGVVGMALALAGCAHVCMTDLPHVLPLTAVNLAANGLAFALGGGACGGQALLPGQLPAEQLLRCRVQLAPLPWGSSAVSALQLPAPPDLIVGGDIVYQPEHYEALVDTLQALSAPHTLIFLSYKVRWLAGWMLRVAGWKKSGCMVAGWAGG